VRRARRVGQRQHVDVVVRAEQRLAGEAPLLRARAARLPSGDGRVAGSAAGGAHPARRGCRYGCEALLFLLLLLLLLLLLAQLLAARHPAAERHRAF